LIIVKDELFVWDYSLSAVLCYDLQTGIYKRKKHLELYVNSMNCFNDSILVFYTSYPRYELNPSENFPHLHTLSLDFSTTCDLWTEKFTNDVDEESRVYTNVYTYIKDWNLYIWDDTSIDNIIYCLDKNMKIKPVYKLFLGKYNTDGKYPSMDAKVFKPAEVIKTDRYLFVTGLHIMGSYKRILYDKTTGESKYPFFKTDSLQINFLDDNIAKLPFWPDGYVSQNTFYSFFYWTGISQEALDAFKGENYKILKDYLDSSKDLENPIIFLATVKSSSKY
jgi:hypothetical protein